MQLANNIGRVQLLQAQHKSASRQAGLILCKAKKLKGGTPTKHVQVVLPDGQRQEWLLTNAEDLERALNVNNLGGGALLNKSTEPPRLTVDVEDLEGDQLYHVLAPGHSSPFRTNLTIWLPVDDGASYVRHKFSSVTQADFRHLLATCGLIGVRPADKPEDAAVININLLEDGAEYFGVAPETPTLRSAVKRLERVDGKLEEANEDALRERLHHLAALENPGGTVKSICRKKYSRRGEQKVEVDAAVTVSFPNDQPPLAYIAERKRTLTITAFDEVEEKWSSIRVYRGTIPELQEDYGGVQNAQLFVAGDVLATNLTWDEVVEESRQRNIRVFMRNGQEYALELKLA